MALPQKKRGFRSITIDGGVFNWRHAGMIDVRLAANLKGQSLRIDFDWKDPWLHVQEGNIDFEPVRETPKFVGDAVLFALESGRLPEKASGAYKVLFHDGAFALERPNRRNRNAP